MKKIKIFLASSEELRTEREQFEIEIYRKCKLWYDKGIFLHLEIWEDLTTKMSPTRSQGEYNKKIKECDLFVLLAHTRVGCFTAEEFEIAVGKFQATQKPFIYTYFKDTSGIDPNRVEKSLETFQKKIRELEHFYSRYKNFDDLWNQFGKELDRLDQTGFKEFVFTRDGSGRPVPAARQINITKGNYIENAGDVTINYS